MILKNFNALGWSILVVCVVASFFIDWLLKYHIELKAGLGVVASLLILVVGLVLALRFGVKRPFKK